MAPDIRKIERELFPPDVLRELHLRELEDLLRGDSGEATDGE